MERKQQWAILAGAGGVTGLGSFSHISYLRMVPYSSFKNT